MSEPGFGTGVALGITVVVVGSIALYVTVVRAALVKNGAKRISQEVARQIGRVAIPPALAQQLVVEANIEGVSRDALNAALP